MKTRLMILAMVCVSLMMAVGDAQGGGGIDVVIVRPLTSSLPGTSGGVIFSVKFVCGTISAKTALPLAPGLYRTVINIQNLNSTPAIVAFSFNGVLRFDTPIPAGRVFSIDCQGTPLGPPGMGFPNLPTFFEGFVGVIPESVNDNLNVVAVYTQQ